VLYLDALAGLFGLGLWLFCIVDVITTDEALVRSNLPKTAWVFLVLFLFDIGAIAWLVAGRPQAWQRSLPYKRSAGVPPEYDLPGRATAFNPDDDDEFLMQLRARAEAQRKTASEQARLLREQEDQPPQT
jgi:hypothetical protein